MKTSKYVYNNHSRLACSQLRPNVTTEPKFRVFEKKMKATLYLHQLSANTYQRYYYCVTDWLKIHSVNQDRQIRRKRLPRGVESSKVLYHSTMGWIRIYIELYVMSIQIHHQEGCREKSQTRCGGKEVGCLGSNVRNKPGTS